jgi:conjugal transfer pilus assembly protein TrbC
VLATKNNCTACGFTRGLSWGLTLALIAAVLFLFRRHRRSLSLVIVASLPAFMSPAHAQSNATVSDADIARVQRSQPVITDQDIERARQKYAMPSEAQLRAAAPRSTPKIDALPQPKTARPLDLEAIAKGFEANADVAAQAQALRSGPRLLVFVSFTLPEATLKRLVDQASRAGATLVLRGFAAGSLRETVSRVQAIKGKSDVAIEIDPQAFDRFAIARTPSFVLVREGASTTSCASGQCFASDAFVSVAGDVSLDYALEHIERSAPRFALGAASFLNKIRSAR